MSQGNGFIRLPTFITVVALLAGFVVGGYAYTTVRVESVRIEVKSDLQRLEDNIISEIRQLERR